MLGLMRTWRASLTSAQDARIKKKISICDLKRGRRQQPSRKLVLLHPSPDKQKQNTRDLNWRVSRFIHLKEFLELCFLRKWVKGPPASVMCVFFSRSLSAASWQRGYEQKPTSACRLNGGTIWPPPHPEDNYAKTIAASLSLTSSNGEKLPLPSIKRIIWIMRRDVYWHISAGVAFSLGAILKTPNSIRFKVQTSHSQWLFRPAFLGKDSCENEPLPWKWYSWAGRVFYVCERVDAHILVHLLS